MLRHRALFSPKNRAAKHLKPKRFGYKPNLGDGDCYEALEVIAFIPASQSSSGEVEWIGEYQPTW